MHTVSIITAPSDLGLRPTGVARLPQALREAGVLRGVDDVASGMQRFRHKPGDRRPLRCRCAWSRWARQMSLPSRRP
jgi:hypothetical protein